MNGGKEASLTVRGVSKSYGHVKALSKAELSLFPGEIHALLGENGAGKSTLAKVCSGHVTRDAGELIWRGRAVDWKGPGEALTGGICLLEQDVQWVPGLTLGECLGVGREHKRWGLLTDSVRMNQEADELLKRVGLSHEARETVDGLSVPERQLLGVARALALKPDLLILDEPTAVLSQEQVDKLFQFLKEMAGQNRSILFITHKLKEVVRICDKATILREGKSRGIFAVAETSAEELLREMAGPMEVSPRESAVPIETEEILRADRLRVSALPGSCGLREVSFSVRKGEMIAFVGAAGNGQRELFAFLSGASKAEAGEVSLRGRPFPSGTAELRKQGVRFVPEDRAQGGLVLDLNLWQNRLLGGVASQTRGCFAWMDPTRLSSQTQSVLRDWQILAGGPRESAGFLSGGNQQKLLLARELEGEPCLVVAASPTRGLDPHTAVLIRDKLKAVCGRGGSVILISRDLEEVEGLFHRVWVLFRGRAELLPEDASVQNIMSLWTGMEEACDG